jgi:hypothetical protein
MRWDSKVRPMPLELLGAEIGGRGAAGDGRYDVWCQEAQINQAGHVEPRCLPGRQRWIRVFLSGTRALEERRPAKKGCDDNTSRLS